MKNILSFIKTQKVKKELKSVQERFPLSIPMILTLAIFFLFIIHGDTNPDSIVVKIVLSLIVTIFLSL